MNHLSKLCTNKRLYALIQTLSMGITSVLMFYPLIAGDKTIWDTSESFGNNFLLKLQKFYNNGIFLTALILNLILWALFASDEKKRAMFAKAMKYECAAFIILQIPTIITGTLNLFATWINGGH